mgnify:CR=1 FL=1
MWVIYYLSSLPNPLKEIIPSSLFPYFDLERFFYHIIEYLILSLLLYRALKTTSKNPQTLALLITILYAISDEIHQFYIPGRIPSVFDIAIDSLGAIAMQSILNIYFWLKS